MKFSYLVLTLSLAAAPALAQDGQASAEASATPATVVNVNTSNTAASTSAATQTTVQETVQQPITVVEAAPVVESKADAIRKARQNAELQTEQKIVEKLEDSRMQDEQRRAEKLFGNTNINNAEATAVIVAPTVVAPTVAAPVVAEIKEVQPTQVTIEKVEIIQPAATQAPAQIVTEAPAAEVTKDERRMYMSLGLGNAAYDANNVDSSYSLGIAVGMINNNRLAVEGIFGYSNHNVDTYWSQPIYRELDQYDIGVGAKYFFLNGMIRPYVGGQILYIYRSYQDRDYYCPSCTDDTESETTQAVNLGPSLGVDVALSDSFSLGADFKYNMNFINKKEIDYSAYGVDDGTTPLEEIDYYTFQITGKMTF